MMLTKLNCIISDVNKVDYEWSFLLRRVHWRLNTFAKCFSTSCQWRLNTKDCLISAQLLSDSWLCCFLEIIKNILFHYTSLSAKSCFISVTPINQPIAFQLEAYLTLAFIPTVYLQWWIFMNILSWILMLKDCSKHSAYSDESC